MEVPVKVTFVGDHAAARMFTRYAKTRMFILERHMQLFGLDQYSREDVPVEGVHVQSIKTFGHREVIITVADQTVGRQRLIEEVLEITNEKVAQELGGLPPNKMHCSNLGADALHKAIEDYKKKNGQV